MDILSYLFVSFCFGVQPVRFGEGSTWHTVVLQEACDHFWSQAGWTDRNSLEVCNSGHNLGMCQNSGTPPPNPPPKKKRFSSVDLLTRHLRGASSKGDTPICLAAVGHVAPNRRSCAECGNPEKG